MIDPLCGFRRLSVACLLLVALGVGARALCDEPSPALEVRLIKPEQQLAEILKLFEGTKAASPAEALSLWKRADPTQTLGKPLEAVIALVNPKMIAEIRNLDDATLRLNLKAGKLDWWVAIPHDDGTLAAAGPALALTDGGPEPMLDGASVYRLGSAVGPLMAQKGSMVAVAMDRDLLARGLNARPRNHTPVESGWAIQINPSAIGPDVPANIKPWTEGLKAFNATSIEALMTLKGGGLELNVKTTLARPPIGPRPVIDPSWFILPNGQPMAEFELAIDSTPEGRDRVFEVIDRVERLRPDRANIAPARVRLTLLAAARGANLETDLWPGLRGISGTITADEGRTPNQGMILLHFKDKAAADRGEQLVNKLGKGLKVTVDRKATTVGIATSPQSLSVALAADFSRRGPVMKLGLDPIERYVAVWPGRWPGLEDEVLAHDGSPILWIGNSSATGLRDQIRFDGSQELIQRMLARSIGK